MTSNRHIDDEDLVIGPSFDGGEAADLPSYDGVEGEAGLKHIGIMGIDFPDVSFNALG